MSPPLDVTQTRERASPVPVDLTGRTLGEFVVSAKIGEGGFGDVYLAHQPLLGREGVIKVLRGADLGLAAISRFMREAQLASRLDHPFAAHIYSFGAEPDGLLWIAMERVRGTPLNEMLKASGPMPLSKFVSLLEGLCEVVHSAHEQSIVHRDIKPSNVMVVARAGRVFPKLLDFGVAKLRGEAGAVDPTLAGLTTTSRVRREPLPDIALTEQQRMEATSVVEAARDRSGPSSSPDVMSLASVASHSVHLEVTSGDSYVGSPAFMAPEQWSSSSTVDARADIYSLGILAYQALTGSLPFRATTAVQMAKLHAEAPVPPLPASFPAELNGVLRRALAKRVEDRYATALELASDFRSAAQLGDEVPPLPKLDSNLVHTLLSDAPRPVAEAIAMLDAAHSPRQAWEASGRLLSTLVRYLAVLALAAAARAGLSKATLDRVRTDLRRLLEEELADPQWLSLARELLAGSQGRAEVHPLPELVELFFPASGAEAVGPRLEAALRTAQRVCAATGLPDAELRTQLATYFRELTTLLRGLSFLVEYPVVVPESGRGARWMGGKRSQLPSMPLKGEGFSDGVVALADAAGGFVLQLFPLVQVGAPAPGAPSELFLLSGQGRFGSKLQALPYEFERQDPNVAGWMQERFPGLTAISRLRSASDDAPYRGLLSFTAGESGNFFGREKEAQAFANRLRMQAFLAVVGASGAGKSSFVQAGVMPLLPPQWRAVVVRPGHSPLQNLARALAAAGLDVGTLAPDAGPVALATRLRDAVVKQGITLMLVVDQFEELITLCHDEVERGVYVRTLSQATLSVTEPVRVVVTLRDDFLMRVQQLPTMKDRLAEGLQLLNTPPREDLLRIVIEPARRAGFEFEDVKLPGEMVDAVASQPGALALLSFTAAKLWDVRDRQFRHLSRKSYEALGGVGGALAQHAEQMLSSLPAEHQRLVREVFRHLVTAEGTRAVMTRRELRQLLGGSDAADPVLERLIQARLLVASEGQTEGEERIEVTHEALISAWPRLVKWRAEDAESARLRDQLRAAARQWEQRKRPRGLLWRDEALMEFSVWRRRYQGLLTEAEEAFAAASLKEEARGRRRRLALVAGAFLALLFGMFFLFRAQQDAKLRLAQLHEEQGRLQLLAGKPLHALVYLSQALGEGIEGPGLRYMLESGLRSVRAQLATFQAHDSTVIAVQPSARRDLFATAGRDGVLRVWRVGNTEPLVSIAGQSIFQIFAFGPGDRLLAAGDQEGKTHLFELPSGNRLRTFSHGPEPVVGVALSPDGALLVVGTGDQKVHWLNVSTGEQLRTFSYPTMMSRLAFSPDGRVLAVCAGNAVLSNNVDFATRLYDTASGALLRTFEGHQGSIRALKFTPDGGRFVTASEDRTARVWDVASGRALATLEGHTGTVKALAINDAGDRVVTGGLDAAVRLWDLKTFKLAGIGSGHHAPIGWLDFSSDGQLLVSSSSDGIARLWSGRDGRARSRLVGHLESIYGAFFAAGDQQVVTVSEDSAVKYWNSSTTDFSAQLTRLRGAVDFRISPDGERIMAGPFNGALVQVDARSGQVRHSLPITQGEATLFGWSPDGRWAATDDGPRVHLWELATGKKVATLSGHEQTIEWITFSTDSRIALTSSDDGTVRTWEVPSGKALLTPTKHSGRIAMAVLSPDGSRVAGIDGDGWLLVWDSRSGDLLRKWKGHAGWGYPIAFSADAKLVVSGAGDRAVRVWDATTGAERATLRGHSSMISAAEFLPDGRLLLTAGNDGTVKLWDAARWTEIDSYQVGERLNAAHFTPSGDAVVTLGADPGWLTVWSAGRTGLGVDQVAREVSCRVPFRLAGEQVVAVGAEQSQRADCDRPTPTR